MVWCGVARCGAVRYGINIVWCDLTESLNVLYLEPVKAVSTIDWGWDPQWFK